VLVEQRKEERRAEERGEKSTEERGEKSRGERLLRSEEVSGEEAL